MSDSMGTHLMVPMPYLQRQLLPSSACATPPCTAPSVYFSGNPAFQSDISQISGTASVGSMKYNALQAVSKSATRMAWSIRPHTPSPSA